MKNIPFLLLIHFLSIAACTSQKKASNISFLSPESGNINQGDTIALQLNVPSDKKTDSVVYFINNTPINKSIGNEHIYFDSSQLNFVNQLLTAKHYENEEIAESSVSILIVPGKAPEELSFSVVNTYPHDEDSYTQGLEYHDGVLYESTGEYGHSKLR